MDANTNPKPNPNPSLNPNVKPNLNPSHSLDNTPCLHSKNAGASNHPITNVNFKLSCQNLRLVCTHKL